MGPKLRGQVANICSLVHNEVKASKGQKTHNSFEHNSETSRKTRAWQENSQKQAFTSPQQSL